MNLNQLMATLAAIQPDPLFLLMAAGFLGVIIAFLIPVSVDIISKVAGKYNSDVIVRIFQSNPVRRYFPFFVLANIAAMLILRFLAQTEFFTSPQFQTAMWILLTTSLIITATAGYLTYQLERIISDDSVPLEMLIKRVEHDLKHRYISLKKQNIIEAVEGIGDILLYQVSRKNNRSALRGLTELSKMTIKLIRLKLFQPQKYETLVYSYELSNYQKENSKEATTAFCFKNQDMNLGCLAAQVNQLERVYLTAIKDNNSEVARFTLRALHTALQSASAQPDNELAVELLVKKLSNCINISVRDRGFADDQIVSWYIDNMLREPHRGNGSFHIPYLDIYDPYFIKTLRHIIVAGQDSSFRAAVNYMVKNFRFSDYQREKLWGYHYLLRAADFDKYLQLNREERVQRRVRNLIEEENQMYTIAQLGAWLDSFKQLKTVIEDNLLDEVSKAKARLLEGEIKDNAIKHLKYTRLIRLSYAIGTICLLNDKSDYIQYMRDAVAEVAKQEVGLNMVPQTLQELMNDYLIFHDLSKRHNLSASGYRRYVLMLAENLLDKEASKGFYLPFLRPEQVGPGLAQLEGLLNLALADNLRQLKQQQQDAQPAAAAKAAKSGGPQTPVIKFLQEARRETENLLVKAQKNISIRDKAKDTFRAAFMDGFNQRLVVREIFDKYLRRYKNDAKGKYPELPNRPWGINELADKSFFVGSSDSIKRSAYQYGVTLADIENMTLFDNIMKHCRRYSPRNFESFLRRLGNPEDLLLLSSYSGVNRFLKQQERFHLAKHIGHVGGLGDVKSGSKSGKQEDLSKINGFVGYYDINQYPMPVFNFYYRGGGDYLLILHKSRLGQLVQMPLVAHPPANKKYLKLTGKFMYFNLDELSKSPKTVNQYVKDAPPWLQELGDAKQQRDFLKQKVLITALENMSFYPASGESKLKPAKTPNKSRANIGYIISIGERNRIMNVNESIST